MLHQILRRLPHSNLPKFPVINSTPTCQFNSIPKCLSTLGPVTPPPDSFTTQKKRLSFSAASGDKLKIVLFYGSTRESRYVERVGRFVKNMLEHNKLEPTVFDPLHMKFEMLRIPIHFYRDPASAPIWLKDAHSKIQSADGFVLLSTEYNSLPPPALVNMLDHFPRTTYIHRPVALVTYAMGISGGGRAGVSLRSFMQELGMVTIPSITHIPGVDTAFKDESGKCQNELTVTNIKHMAKELYWYADGLKKLRAVKEPPQLVI